MHLFFFSASDPVCSSNSSNVALEGDVVTLLCEVTYRGKWGPRMTWFDRSGAVIASIDSGTRGSVVRHAISVTVVASDEPLSFSCLTDFSDVLDPAPGEHEASNTVDYEHTYTSGDITVHCEYLYRKLCHQQNTIEFSLLRLQRNGRCEESEH